MRRSSGYEIISGHRRKQACSKLSEDETILIMVDSNIQKEVILSREKAFAYKMKLEALNHQEVAYGQVELIAEGTQDSGGHGNFIIFSICESG